MWTRDKAETFIQTSSPDGLFFHKRWLVNRPDVRTCLGIAWNLAKWSPIKFHLRSDSKCPLINSSRNTSLSAWDSIIPRRTNDSEFHLWVPSLRHVQVSISSSFSRFTLYEGLVRDGLWTEKKKEAWEMESTRPNNFSHLSFTVWVGSREGTCLLTLCLVSYDCVSSVDSSSIGLYFSWFPMLVREWIHYWKFPQEWRPVKDYSSTISG
jgi:hypothetical protein